MKINVDNLVKFICIPYLYWMKVMEKKIGKAIKTKEGNYRIEKFTMDKRSQTGSVGVGCYISNKGDTATRLCLQLNRLFNLEQKLLREQGITKAMFVCDIADTVINKVAFGEFILQFDMVEQDVYLKNKEYDIVKDTIISIIEKSTIVVVDK